MSKNSDYHHGNLREELMRVGREQLISVGVEKTSLRAISRALGVSQSAPFRHFKDKNALLIALAAEGFNELAARMTAADKEADDRDRLHAIGLEYVKFAQHHPEIFKLMFSSILEDTENFPDFLTASLNALGVLSSVITRGLNNGSFTEKSEEELTFAAWAIVHGLAHLSIENKGPDQPTDDQLALVKSALETFIYGVSRPRR